ncbi:hypothetical protein [Nonomuraea basaltis]|nr:hypothetical protein [Nonomuraea basaltis]
MNGRTTALLLHAVRGQHAETAWPARGGAAGERAAAVPRVMGAA